MGDFRHFAERSGLRRIREVEYVALSVGLYESVVVGVRHGRCL